MSKIKVIINGESGRMGHELKRVLLSHKKAEYFLGVSNHAASKKNSQKPQVVVIDFSTPQGMREALSACCQLKRPLVSGTTGLLPSDMRLLKAAGKKIPVLWAPNMSLGVNLVLKIIRSIGKNFSKYDLFIEDKHHRYKKDIPSGTAILLQSAIQSVGGRKKPLIQSIRGGGLIGTHKLLLLAEEELLTIEHTAIHRATFAKGAVEAALWLSKQKKGLYTFQDFLKD